MKKIVRAMILTSLTLGAASGLLVHPTEAQGADAATTQSAREVSLRDVGPLVPTARVGGDREFGGNGPRIHCQVKLRLSSDKKAIMADITFHAKETKSDWSEVKETWSRKVYDAPAGRRIASIEGPTQSEVRFTSKRAGFQIFGPGEDFRQFMQKLEQLANMVLDAERKINGRSGDTPEVQNARAWMERIQSGAAEIPFQGNHVHVVAPETHGPVNLFAIVGDTGGDDISDDNNGKDDTRIVAIKFNKVRVKLD